MKYYSPLKPWLARSAPLNSFLDLSSRTPGKELHGFLSFEYVVPVHKASSLFRQSLLESWNKTEKYVTRALEIIDADDPGWLDREEAQWILDELGDPPTYCYPIYMITVGSGGKEEVVYFGKTSSRRGRFSGGHHALTKLNHPKFNRLKKRIYQACIVLLTDEKDYLPLEWVHPYSDAEETLSSVEAQLIYNFKPELNRCSKNNYNATKPVSLHIENFTEQTAYLHDYILYLEDSSTLKNTRHRKK